MGAVSQGSPWFWSLKMETWTLGQGWGVEITLLVIFWHCDEQAGFLFFVCLFLCLSSLCRLARISLGVGSSV